MIAWFLFLVAFAAVLAGSMVGSVQLMASTTQERQARETVARLDQAAAALASRAGLPPSAMPRQAALSNYEATVAVPAGQQQGPVYVLPASLGVSRVTPWGSPIAYCPLAPVGWTDASASQVEIAQPGMAAYQVRVRDGLVVEGRPSWAMPLGPDVLGVLVAPHVRGGTTPRCDQVTYDAATGQVTVPLGVARVVRLSAAPVRSDIQSAGLVIYASPSGNSSAPGTSPDAPTTLMSALNMVASRDIERVRISLAPGNYVLPHSAFNFFPGNGGVFAGRGTSTARFHLAGPPGGSGTAVVSFLPNPSNTTGQGPSAIVYLPYDYIFSDVVMANAQFVVQAGQKAVLRNVSASSVNAGHGHGGLELQNVVLTYDLKPWSDFYAIYVNGGALRLSGSIRARGMYMDTGVDVQVEPGTVIEFLPSLPGQGSLWANLVSVGSNWTMRDGQMVGRSKVDTMIYFRDGLLNLQNVQVSSDFHSLYAILAEDNARIHLAGSAIGVQGVPALVPIVNPSEISGEGTVVRCNASSGPCYCGSGPVFDSSGAYSSSAGWWHHLVRVWHVSQTSGILADPAMPPMTLPPSTAWRDALHSRQVRAEKRRRNQSDWTCISS